MINTLTDIIMDNSIQSIIYKIISKYTYYYEQDDLYQVACMGVVKAYKNYNPSSSAKFQTYAYNYILGSVYEYVTSFKTIKIGEKNQKLSRKINEAKILLTQKLMREPSNYELASFLEIDEHVIDNINLLNKSVDSLDRCISSDEKDLFLYDVIPATSTNQLDKIYLQSELDKLSDYEKQILEFRYFQDKSQQEVSSYLGINQVQVSRTEKKILQKMNQNMVNFVKK